MTTLINFGDSWATGAYTEPQTRYSEYLAKMLGTDYVCCAVPSSSVPGMILQFKSFLERHRRKHETYIALFFLTAKDRQILQLQNDLVETSINAHECVDFYSKYYGDDLGNFVWNSSLLSLRYLCDRYRIVDLYLPGWEINPIWPELDQNRFFDGNRSTVLSLFTEDPGLNLSQSHATYPDWFVTGHPNRDAHRKIADRLRPWVQDFLP